MTLERALNLLGEEDPQALPAINRRYGVRRETLLLAGDYELVARLDAAFDVVSSHYWSVIEPAIRSGYDERRSQRSAAGARAEEQRKAEARGLLRLKGWPDSWAVKDADSWFAHCIPMEHAARWADAGWPADLVFDFFHQGQAEWMEFGLDPELLAADVLTSRLPVALGGDWISCHVSSLASVYAFESRGWCSADVSEVGADVARICLARRFSFDRLREFAALGFRGPRAIDLLDAGVLVSNLVGWDPVFVYRLQDLTDFTRTHRLNDLLGVPGGNRPKTT